MDAGKTFTPLRTPHGDNHDIWINPKDGNILIQSNDGGANVSTDGGRTWSSQLNQPTAEFYGVWLDEQFPYNLYGAQQDSNTVIITSQATPYAREDWRERTRLRDRSDHAAPEGPEHRLRVVQGTVQRDEPEDRPGEAVLDRRAVALRQPGERSHLPDAAGVADGAVAARS